MSDSTESPGGIGSDRGFRWQAQIPDSRRALRHRAPCGEYTQGVGTLGTRNVFLSGLLLQEWMEFVERIVESTAGM